MRMAPTWKDRSDPYMLVLEIIMQRFIPDFVFDIAYVVRTKKNCSADYL